MRVAKFGHSCLLVEAASGERIVIDPGELSAIPEGVISGRIDAVLITHSHGDHLDESLLGKVEAANPGTPIFASADIVAQLAAKGIPATDHEFKNFEVGAVSVEVLQAGHDPVLGPVPDNTAYRIGGELVITGDSTAISLDEWKGTRVLALPTSAPWAARPALANLIERLGPEVTFPVHDGIVIDVFRGWQDAQFSQFAEERGTKYVILGSELVDL